MPPLNLLDNYDQCIVYNDNFATYCFVDSTIEPQPNSDLWRYIEVYCPTTIMITHLLTSLIHRTSPEIKNDTIAMIACSVVFV
jgi:hypothetical protein